MPGHYLLALSDGMGSGREAHRESRAALELMLQALRAGFDRKEALGTVNGMLMPARAVKCMRRWICAWRTWTAARSPLRSWGHARRTFCVRGRCRRLGGDALPLGIVGAATPRRMSARLQPGDMLLLVSDGVVDAFGRDGYGVSARAGRACAAGRRYLRPMAGGYAAQARPGPLPGRCAG